MLRQQRCSVQPSNSAVSGYQQATTQPWSAVRSGDDASEKSRQHRRGRCRREVACLVLERVANRRRTQSWKTPTRAFPYRVAACAFLTPILAHAQPRGSRPRGWRVSDLGRGPDSSGWRRVREKVARCDLVELQDLGAETRERREIRSAARLN
mgnify:FL=1